VIWEFKEKKVKNTLPKKSSPKRSVILMPSDLEKALEETLIHKTEFKKMPW
jgi:hypothetical protein